MYGMRSLRKRPTSSPSGVLISSPTTIRNFRSPGTGSFPTNTSRTRSTVAKSQAKGDSPPRPGPAAVIAALKKPPASKLGAPMKPTEKPSPSRASLRRCRCCCSIARDHEEDRVRETASSRCLHRDGPRIRCALGPLERGLASIHRSALVSRFGWVRFEVSGGGYGGASGLAAGGVPLFFVPLGWMVRWSLIAVGRRLPRTRPSIRFPRASGPAGAGRVSGLRSRFGRGW
jgi:hypothetical protein